MEKKFNADLAAKIKEPQMDALIAIRFLANLGYDHVTYRFLGTTIQLVVFEDTELEIKKTESLLDTILENGWESSIVHSFSQSGDEYYYITYEYNLDK